MDRQPLLTELRATSFNVEHSVSCYRFWPRSAHLLQEGIWKKIVLI